MISTFNFYKKLIFWIHVLHTYSMYSMLHVVLHVHVVHLLQHNSTVISYLLLA
jgi:hypothetical protein